MTAAALGLSGCSRPTQSEATDAGPAGSNRAIVKRGNFRRTMRLHGTVEAVQSFKVITPRLSIQTASMMVITKMARNGAQVRKGDILVEFDCQNQMQEILDKQAEYDNLVQQIKKKQADQAAAFSADETELKGAEVDLQTARVEMRKNDVIASIQAEINKVNLAEAQAKLEQLKDTFALKREAAAAELRILEIQRDRAQKAATYAQSNVEKMTIKSPLDGLVVYVAIYKTARMADPQEGDEVRPGQNIMLVVDPSAMQVVARLNQVDVSDARVGQDAETHLDAYPELVFRGKVERISAVGASSYESKRIRFFSAVISIDGSHPKLLPDLTAAVDIEVESLDNVLILPRDAVVMIGSQTIVEVINNGKSERRPVAIRAQNDFEVAIESGLEEGMIVSLNPRIEDDKSVQKSG